MPAPAAILDLVARFDEHIDSFFVEAKKPSVRIKDDISPAYQLRRYGWNAKLPLSILSDFEEFSIYDTRIKPKRNEAASKARIFYCNYTGHIVVCEEPVAHITDRQSVLDTAKSKETAL